MALNFDQSARVKQLEELPIGSAVYSPYHKEKFKKIQVGYMTSWKSLDDGKRVISDYQIAAPGNFQVIRRGETILDYAARCEKLQELPEKSMVFIPKTGKLFMKKWGYWQDLTDAWDRRSDNILAVYDFEITLDTSKETDVNNRTEDERKALLDHLNRLPRESIVYLAGERSFYKKIEDYSWFNPETSVQIHPGILVQMGDFDIVRVGGIDEWNPKVGKFAQLTERTGKIPSSVRIVQVMAIGQSQSRIRWVGESGPHESYEEIVNTDTLIDPMTDFYAEGEFWQAYRRQAEKGNVLDTNQ